MNPLIFFPIVISLLVSIFLLPFWIRKARQIGLMWDDMNKYHKSKVAGSGGIITILAFILGVLTFIAYRTFYLSTSENLSEMLGIIAVSLMLGGIGLIDDLLGWQRGGLSKRSRLILVAIASIPLAAINAGRADIALPFVGPINLGLIYPLVIIPLGIVGASTTFNMMAGFNGLEAGQGIIMLSGLSIVAFWTGNTWLTVIALCMIFALLGFLYYNIYPARVFPGDSLTYTVGGLIAMIPILGNFERIAVFFFIPYIIEVVLKSRGRLVKQSFGKPNSDNSLDNLYNKVYSIGHIAIWAFKKMGIKPTEKKVVLAIWSLQIIVIIIGLFIFRQKIIL